MSTSWQLAYKCSLDRVPYKASGGCMVGRSLRPAGQKESAKGRQVGFHHCMWSEGSGFQQER
jgi:hypothetical protein